MALDLATKTGWCYFPSNVIVGEVHLQQIIPANYQSGVKTIGNAHSSLGSFFNEYRIWLRERLIVMRPFGVVYEAPFVRTGGKNKAGRGGFANEAAIARKLFGLTAVTEEVVYDMQLPWIRQVKVEAIKKHWAHNGHATKEDMVAVAENYGFKPKDDNEADAIALAHYTWTIERAKKGRS